MSKEKEEVKAKPSAWKDLTAGMFGGACLVAAGYPLDTIKVRLQTQPKPPPGQPPKFTGALDCFWKTVRTEGVRGLYKGMTSPLMGVPPIYAIVFGAYGQAKKLFQKDPNDTLTLSQIFYAGCITGIATTPITAPIEAVKARMQIQYARPAGVPATYTGPFDCAKKMFQAEGFKAIGKGSVATYWRDIPGTGAWFLANEFVKRKFIPEGGTAADVGPLPLLLAGGCAGIANWLAVYPIDIFKSRVQTDTTGKYAPGHRGLWQAYQEVVAEAGWRGCFKGLGPALLRSFPANAACFLGYEVASRVLNSV